MTTKLNSELRNTVLGSDSCLLVNLLQKTYTPLRKTKKTIEKTKKDKKNRKNKNPNVKNSKNTNNSKEEI